MVRTVDVETSLAVDHGSVVVSDLSNLCNSNRILPASVQSSFGASSFRMASGVDYDHSSDVDARASVAV